MTLTSLYRLGNKVKFKSELVRQCLSNDKSDNRYFEKIHTNILEGIICGSRNIHTRGYTAYDSGAGYYFVPLKTERIYLVATKMNSFHKVPERLFLDTIKEELL